MCADDVGNNVNNTPYFRILTTPKCMYACDVICLEIFVRICIWGIGPLCSQLRTTSRHSRRKTWPCFAFATLRCLLRCRAEYEYEKQTTSFLPIQRAINRPRLMLRASYNADVAFCMTLARWLCFSIVRAAIIGLDSMHETVLHSLQNSNRFFFCNGLFITNYNIDWYTFIFWMTAVRMLTFRNWKIAKTSRRINNNLNNFTKKICFDFLFRDNSTSVFLYYFCWTLKIKWTQIVFVFFEFSLKIQFVHSKTFCENFITIEIVQLFKFLFNESIMIFHSNWRQISMIFKIIDNFYFEFDIVHVIFNCDNFYTHIY